MLQSALAHADIPSSVRYFSIRFAEIIGEPLYLPISHSAGVPVVELAGEWIFSDALFDRPDNSGDAYARDVLRERAAWSSPDCAPRLSEARIRGIVRARQHAPAFLDWCVEQVIAARPRVVGLTSSFQQHVASLALARRLKAALPELRVVMGGANCEAVMGAETVRQFPFIDAVVSGEADLIIVDLIQRLRDGRPLDDLAGVVTPANIARQFASGRFANAPVVRDMGALPLPDYTDYMRQFEASRFARRWQPNVLFESSRGCWWGEKAHCTFCGLNGSTMVFRSKSADRTLAELTHFAERYPKAPIQIVDNILEMAYFADLLPRLASGSISFDLFYETKANLKKEQVRLLAAAGVARIQPGIESLSDPVLAQMRKGVTWLQNIQLLKWCKELGVEPYWNWLWGFPGESAAEYERMTQLIPWLTHLRAPVGAAAIRLDRFSPNYDEAARFGFTHVRPVESYRYVYAELPGEAIRNLAYYFNFEYADGRRASDYARPLQRQVAAWKRAHARSELVSIEAGSALLICDFRPAAIQRVTRLEGIDRALYESCDAAAHVRSLGALVGGNGDQPDGPAEVRARLQPLMARGLIVSDGSRYLSLAIPIGDYQPPAAVRARVRRIMRALDRPSAPPARPRVKRSRAVRRRVRA